MSQEATPPQAGASW